MGLRPAFNEKSKPFEFIHSVFVERCFKCRTRSLDSTIFIWLLRKIKSLVVSRGCIDYRSQRLDLKTKKAFGVKK